MATHLGKREGKPLPSSVRSGGKKVRETSLPTHRVEEEEEVVVQGLEQIPHRGLRARAGGHGLKDTAGCGEPTLEQAYPEGLQPVEREEG